MKKLIFVFAAVVAFSCGDGSNRSSDTTPGIETEDNFSRDALDADTTDMQMDTAAAPAMDRGGDLRQERELPDEK